MERAKRHLRLLSGFHPKAGGKAMVEEINNAEMVVYKRLSPEKSEVDNR